MFSLKLVSSDIAVEFQMYDDDITMSGSKSLRCSKPSRIPNPPRVIPHLLQANGGGEKEKLSRGVIVQPYQ